MKKRNKNKKAIMSLKKVLIILIIILVVAIALASAYFIFLKNQIANLVPHPDAACVQLNCTTTTHYVGSLKSDKYYVCSCRYAKSILPDNLICFSSDAEAEKYNYTKIQC